MEDTPWKNEELKKLEEALPRLERGRSGKGIQIVQDENRCGMRRLPPKSILGFDKRNEGRNRGVPGEGGTKVKVAAASLHDDVLLDTEECHERETDCSHANVDSLVGSFEST